MPLPSLLKLQQQFLEYIYTDAETSPILAHIAPHNGITPAARMGVYRTATRLILRDLLQNTFPVTVRLVSLDFFRHAADQFVQQHPPSQGDMGVYGENFPKFLADFPTLIEHPYVTDMAKLEWLREESYHAADIATLRPEQLTEVTETDLPNLRLPLHPSTRLMASSYPILTLWETFREQDSGTTPDLTKGAEYVLIHRVNGLIQLTQITPEAYTFLQSCQANVTLSTALANSLITTPETLLAELIALNIFSEPTT